MRDFHLFSRGWSVCVYIWQLIQPTLFIYLAQERWHRILFVTGGARWSPPDCVRACADLCICSVISHRRFHVGAAGVCDRFHHLDGSVLMNILIISLNARACWVSSRPPFPEINMEKRGWGGKVLQRDVDSRLMLLLAPRQPNLSLTCCHFVIIFDNANTAMFAYLHCQLLTNVTD